MASVRVTKGEVRRRPKEEEEENMRREGG